MKSADLRDNQFVFKTKYYSYGSIDWWVTGWFATTCRVAFVWRTLALALRDVVLRVLILRRVLAAHGFLDLSASGRCKGDLLGHEVAALQLTVLIIVTVRRKESDWTTLFYIDTAHSQALFLLLKVAVWHGSLKRIAGEIISRLNNDLHGALFIDLHAFVVTTVRRNTYHRLIIVVLGGRYGFNHFNARIHLTKDNLLDFIFH